MSRVKHTIKQTSRNDEPLTTAEFAELEKYEDMAKKKVITTKSKPAKQRRRKLKKSKPVPINPEQIKLLAMTCENMVEAAAEIGKSLAKLFEKDLKLAAAWERGRFLKDIAGLATTPVSISEAEFELKLDAGALEKLFADDIEAADVWNQARLKTIIRIKRAMVQKAEEASPAALKQIDNLLRREIAKQAIDYAHITTNQLVEITGRTRQTIHDWVSKNSCPRNGDKTFNMREFLDWFEKFTVGKMSPASKKMDNSLAEKKAVKMQMAIERELGELLDRREVIAGLIARVQLLKSLHDRRADKLPEIIVNQPEQRIKQVLADSFEEIIAEFIASPLDLKLNELQENKLNEFFNEIRSVEKKEE